MYNPTAFLKNGARTLSETLDGDFKIISDSNPCSSSSIKRPAAEEAVEIEAREEERKRKKLDEAAKPAKLKKRSMQTQVNKLYACRQLLERLSSWEISRLLPKNSQEISVEEQNHKSELLNRLVDIIVFGVPGDCPMCSNGIVYKSLRRTYVCTGYVTEYTKCTFESKNPERRPFEPSDRLRQRFPTLDFNPLAERLYIEEKEANGLAVQKSDKPRMCVAEVFDSKHVVPKTTPDDYTYLIKKRTLVDAKFEYAETSHVFKDEVDEYLYQATLSWTDVTENRNSYYKIQLLKNDAYDYFYVYHSWGRLGTAVRNHKHQSYFNKDEAVKEFKKSFNEKTKNRWEHRKKFRKMSGAFSYVETDQSEFAQILEDVVPGTETKLPTPVKEIVMDIFNIENRKPELKSIKMDPNGMPFGRLSHNQLDLAFEVLKDLNEVLSEVPLDQMKIVDSTNKFYTIIPHNFGLTLPEFIDNLDKINAKIKMLNAIRDLNFAFDKICGLDSRTIPGVDPVDTHYQRLNCLMTPLDKNSSEYGLIKDYMDNTQGSTHDIKWDLIDILEINRESESTKFKSHIKNRKLLWHGSRRTNLAGILGQGLRIAPPEAEASGYMFGRGVYFADMFSKSLFYCRANRQDVAYLLLCDVALGVMDPRLEATDMSKDTLPEGTHSVKGLGWQCPSEESPHPDGFMVPTGKVRQQLLGTHLVDFSLLYNEYIVYDVDQIRIKYLVRVKVK